jgi:hypothetical protein
VTALHGDAVDPGVAGVTGVSKQFNGVLGTTTANGQAGVAGVSDAGVGNGIFGRSKNGNGVFGISEASDAAGVVGTCENNDGVRGLSNSKDHSGVAAVNSNPAGCGIFAKGTRVAGLFEGHVEVTGDLKMINGDIKLINADCAEDFDIGTITSADPGTVMVLGEEGALFPSEHAYDKRVAGVVSGAGDYKPAIVLDRQSSNRTRQPIALVGKAFCKIDAQFGAVEIGDLLTTSSTPGHAMKAQDSTKAFGAVIGKALRPLTHGRGLIPILVGLQ